MKSIRPMHDYVVLRPEAVEVAEARVSKVLKLFSSETHVQGGYPEGYLYAEVLRTGPECKLVKPGEVVLLHAYKNLEDSRFEDVLVVHEDQLLAVKEP